MIVAFTGHRPEKLGGYGPSPTQDRVRQAIRDLLENVGYHTCDCGRSRWGRMSDLCSCGEMRCGTVSYATETISGMALGVDQWAAEICVELGVPFTAAVPFVGQESRWPEESQRRYQLLLQKAYNVVVVSPGGYHPWKMQARNEWMVDRCDLLVAFWDGSGGGTANCVEYAQRVGRQIWRVDPRLM